MREIKMVVLLRFFTSTVCRKIVHAYSSISFCKDIPFVSIFLHLKAVFTVSFKFSKKKAYIFGHDTMEYKNAYILVLYLMLSGLILVC